MRDEPKIISSPVPVYVPKRRPGNTEPWIEFGSSEFEYRRWIPEICGICCLKMVGDTIGSTNELSLYKLTLMAAANGTFIAGEQGTIQGAFHYPLAELAQRLGIRCHVVRPLGIGEIRAALSRGMYAILSIDAAQVDQALQGGHLVLIYGYDEPTDSFLLHDCSSIIQPDGCGVNISTHALARISNNKGLVAALVPQEDPKPIVLLVSAVRGLDQHVTEYGAQVKPGGRHSHRRVLVSVSPGITAVSRKKT